MEVPIDPNPIAGQYQNSQLESMVETENEELGESSGEVSEAKMPIPIDWMGDLDAKNTFENIKNSSYWYRYVNSTWQGPNGHMAPR